MFGMGWQEILLIMVVAVLVIGPEQLPQVARTLGKVIAQFRRVTNDLRDQVNREFHENESLRDFKEFQNSIDSEVRGIGYSVQDYVDKEVAKGEAELNQLDEEVRASGGDPGPLTDPDAVADDAADSPPADAAGWTPTDDFPTDDPAPAPEAVAEETGEPAAPEDKADEEPVERSTTRRETA